MRGDYRDHAGLSNWTLAKMMVEKPIKNRKSALSWPNLATQPLPRLLFIFSAWKSVVLTHLVLVLTGLILIVGQSLVAPRVAFNYLTAHACSLSCLNSGSHQYFQYSGDYSTVVLVERFKRGLSSAAETLVRESTACAICASIRACESSRIVLTASVSDYGLICQC